ncbi:hypothetical protein B0T26DRAFT_634906 [Lasiosphaeria miniovina]|uniref:FR47-like domain-containing protein n=1 Tax=Lasiosphaeria miniovina TaxID=1954250 RepID=A0AA40BHF3_9PEZI|nr:uncharacterized protein B0T26DRAFT_634906 [Lasiosphaeria miniovina]KAK0734249.1 hypothetical protein B0T26DRAFT_634906 [Lasiosphaeria miniovina]
MAPRIIIQEHLPTTTAAEGEVSAATDANRSLQDRLRQHIPHSLALLRRLQFAGKFAGTSPATARVLHAYYSSTSPEGSSSSSSSDGPFAAAYVDLSRGPETECWLYSSLEDSCASAAHTTDDERTRLTTSCAAADSDAAAAMDLGHLRGGVVVGALNEAVRARLGERGVLMGSTIAIPRGMDWDWCAKWLFRLDALPGGGGGEMEKMRWDTARREDLDVILSRTAVPYSPATLLTLPNTVVRLDDGIPIAWAFLGLDGTTKTLHVEEPYRRRGLAKAVAAKLMRAHLKDYGDDGWGGADVSVANLKSQAACKSIGGTLGWVLSW